MAERDPTCIGRVRHVLGATVTVELDATLAGVAPIWEGHLQSVGQVGTLVRIPQGPVTLVATVTLVGISEVSEPLSPSSATEVGNRWLQVQLLGEVDGLGIFHRGISNYPGLDDTVHFTTASELASLYPPANSDRVQIGHLASSPEVPFTLDAARLVTRHGAVVGSTGAGKTTAVATLAQHLIDGGWSSANILIIDPHGEYSAAFPTTGMVRSVLADNTSLLRVPFWALPADGILQAFCGEVDSSTARSRFSELVTVGRREFAEAASWLNIDAAAIGADTPIPFDLSSIWYSLAYDNQATYSDQGGGGDPSEIDAGEAATLKPPTFKTHGLGSAPPFKGPSYGIYGTVPERLRRSLLDPRLRFFRQPAADPNGNDDPLVAVLDEWLGGAAPVSVLDFSGVPAEVADLAIGVVLQLIFELAIRSESDGVGRPRPVLVVLEEAHRYLNEDIGSVRLARTVVNRLAREGRKYGVGLLLVTQRPAELPATALAQVGTIVALRLTNGTDQGVVKAALPDSVAGLADALPALRTGEAIVAGEAVTLPSRALLTPADPPPRADDPSLDTWRDDPSTPNVLQTAVARWRADAGGG